MHLALTLNQGEISWPNHATAKLCSKAVLLFWFSLIVLVRQLSVCLRLLVYFVRDSLMVIYWESAVLLDFRVWCFTLCRLYCIIFPFGVSVCSWSLPFICVFMKVCFFVFCIWCPLSNDLFLMQFLLSMFRLLLFLWLHSMICVRSSVLNDVVLLRRCYFLSL